MTRRQSSYPNNMIFDKVCERNIYSTVGRMEIAKIQFWGNSGHRKDPDWFDSSSPGSLNCPLVGPPKRVKRWQNHQWEGADMPASCHGWGIMQSSYIDGALLWNARAHQNISNNKTWSFSFVQWKDHFTNPPFP